MKKISILFNQSLKLIQGINYVNNSFVMGGEYFKEYGLELSKIYAPDGVFDCKNQDHLTLIGSDIGTRAYRKKRIIREFLREMFSSKYLLGAWIKLYFNHIRNGKKVIENFIKTDDDSDYLIFQDMESLFQYCKRGLKNDRVKTLLILHCSNHPLEQMIPDFIGFFSHVKLKNRYIARCDEAMDAVDKVVYLSKHAVECSPLQSDKITCIFNGIEDLERVSVVPVHNPLQLVSVGSVNIHKGQHLIIEAVALLNKEQRDKMHVTIVGGGNEYGLCKHLVEKNCLQDTITMTGPRNDVAEILKEMDVFVLPSKSEGMPMSILEAMRQGLYIISTETGGIPEMIEPEYGELVTRDIKQLSTAIKSLVEDEKVTFETKLSSRKRYEDDFTLRKMIERYSHVLLSIK